jgi:hypothetical protein
MLHVSPGLTRTNLLHVPTMPSCTGVGVAMPLPLMRPTHAYVLACRFLQFDPTAGFHSFTHWVPGAPSQKATLSHVSPGLTKKNLLQLSIMPG